MEKKIGPHLIADILLTTSKKNKIVFEYQNSYRDSHYIIGKTTKYSQYGIYCGWIFNTSLIKTNQVNEVFITYGGVGFFYDPNTDILYCNNKILLSPTEYNSKRNAVEEEILYNTESYKLEVECAASDLGYGYSRADFVSAEIPHEYSEIVDLAADKVMSKYGKIELKLDIASYLNIGMRRAYLSLK